MLFKKTLTKAHQKKSMSHPRHPLQLSNQFVTTGQRSRGTLVDNFHKSFHCRRQLGTRGSLQCFGKAKLGASCHAFGKFAQQLTVALLPHKFAGRRYPTCSGATAGQNLFLQQLLLLIDLLLCGHTEEAYGWRSGQMNLQFFSQIFW